MNVIICIIKKVMSRIFDTTCTSSSTLMINLASHNIIPKPGEMLVISSYPKPTINHNLYENTGPGVHFVWRYSIKIK